MIRLGRTVPPAAAPIAAREIAAGVQGLFHGAGAIDRLAAEMRAFFGAKRCFLVSSGKAALVVALQALREGHPGRNRVLIPAYTCYSVPAAIVRAGLRVDLCDIDPHGFDYDFSQLSRKIGNPDLLCIVSTHLFGVPADVARTRKLAAGRGIPIVEDAAQAFGEESDAGQLGTIGDIGIFSFGRGKALSAVEGGMVLTGSSRLATAAGRQVAALPGYSLRQTISLVIQAMSLNVLIRPDCFWLPKGVPALRLGETIFDPDFPLRRMSPFQAALLQDWKPRLAEFQAARLRNVEYWHETLGSSAKRYLRLPGEEATLLRYPLVVPDRSLRTALLAESDRRGLGLAPGYPDTIAGIPVFRKDFAAGDFPNARARAAHLLTLPVHPLVSRRDREEIAALLRTKAVFGHEGNA